MGSTGTFKLSIESEITCTFSPDLIIPAISSTIAGCMSLVSFPKQKRAACASAADIAVMTSWTKYHHRGKRWGAEMDLNKRTVVEGATAMPPVLTALITRMQQMPLLQHFQPNEANAIDYRQGLGHWLKPHVDDRSVSLMTCSVFMTHRVGTACSCCITMNHDATRQPSVSLLS